jgi:DNA-directed RNA polymerase alpha subunit
VILIQEHGDIVCFENQTNHLNLLYKSLAMKEKETHPFGKLSNPAQRALANSGITTLDELSKLTEAEIMKLHGIGKSSIPTLKAAMAQKGLSFAE